MPMTVRPLFFGAAAFAILALAGCAGDDEGQAASPFSEALSRNYTDLANQVAEVPAPESDSDDFFSNPFGLFGDSTESMNDLLVKAFTTKADLASQGEEPAPEPAPPDPTAQTLHDRLVRGVAAGKDRFPEQ